MKQAFIIALNLLAISLSAQTVTSNFDVNTEGWTPVQRPLGGLFAPTLTYQPNQGVNNSGAISLRDNIPVGGFTFYFSAPAKFLGNKSWAYNQNLNFDMRLNIGTTTFGGFDDVIIEGTNGTRVFMNLPAIPTSGWNTFSITLNETFWQFGNRPGTPATIDQLQNILCNISRILIRGEYYNGDDQGFLDNVVLEADVPCTEVIRQSFNLCPGQFVRVGTKTYGIPGTYTDAIKNCYPVCDTTYITTISLVASTNRTIDTAICPNTTIAINGKNYNQAGRFTDAIKSINGCDSVNLTINVTLKNVPTRGQTISICEGQSYKIGARTYTQAGVYQDTFRAANGCDSIVITSLIVKPSSFNIQTVRICPGGFVKVGNNTYRAEGFYTDTLQNRQGCDSVVVTNVEIKPTSIVLQNRVICAGEVLRVGSKTYTISGSYKDTLRTFEGCDSIVNTNLLVLPPLSSTQNVKICEGDNLQVGTNFYTRTGIFKDTLKSITGCDSIVTTNLTVNTKYNYTQEASICPNSTYRVGNNVYTRAGTYRDTLKTIAGCDSIIITDLKVKAQAIKTQNITLCSGGVVSVGTKRYTQTGVYRDTFRTVSGCDSIVTTNLTINPHSAKTQNLTLCQGEKVEVGFKSYNITGIFRDTLQNWLGCDSVVTTNLTIVPPLSISQNIKICEGDFLKIGAKSYAQAGIYKDTLKSITGCDSIITTNLTVNKGTSITRNVTICPNEIYRVGASAYKTAGTYRDTFNTFQGCDSIIVSNITVRTTAFKEQSASICAGDVFRVGAKFYRISGIYRDTFLSAAGCDSIVTTNLTVKPTTTKTQDISLCKGSSYNIGIKTYTQAGIYRDVLTNVLGCDSVVTTTIKIIDPLSITQNLNVCEGDFIKIGTKNFRPTSTATYKDTLKSIITGCDSIVTTNVTLNKKYTETQNVTICPNGSHVVGSFTYTQAGTYRDTFKSITGCDSVIITVLAIKNQATRTQNINLCNGQTYKIANKTYTQSGVYVDTLRSIGGCDSVVTTNLKIESVFTKNQNIAICEGESLRVGFKTYNRSGFYIDTLKTVAGCDSIVGTILKVNPIISTVQNYNICPSGFVAVGTKRYSLSGTYKDTLKSITGCDSIVTSIVKVNNNTTNFQNISLCAGQSYSIGTKTYNRAGTYRDTLRNVFGCDSIVTTTLAFNAAITKSQSIEICNGDAVRVGNRVYIQAGIFKDTLRAIAGCDSIVTTLITIKPTAFKQIDSTICEGKSLIINGKTYDKTGLYRDAVTRGNSCDSIISISLTVQPYLVQRENFVICPQDTVFSNGRLARGVGVYRDTVSSTSKCDYILELNISKSPLQLNLGADINLIQGDSIQLTPSVLGTQNGRLKWQTNSTLKCSTCPNPYVKPSLTTTYILEVTDTLSGCSVRDAVQVFVKSCASAFVPTAFSPNDDGQNDYFMVYSTGCIKKVKKMQIFNRWGSLVFSKENFLPNSEKEGWDGTFNNKTLPTDVYAYVVEVELPEGKTEMIWGDVTLLR